MAVVAPVRSPELDSWLDNRPLSSNVVSSGMTSTDDGHTEDPPRSSNGWHSPINGNGKAEPRHMDSHGDDETASNLDQGTVVHESEGGEDEDESEEVDDGEDEEEEGEEDYEDEEEDEPTLKYERMGGPINDLLKKDSASALAVSNTHLVNLLSPWCE